MTKTLDKKTQEAKREIKVSKDLDKPKSYDDFIKNIAKSFNIKNKKSINLILITTDDEDFGINTQEDLDDNIGELKEFNVFLEEGEQPPIIEMEDPPKKQTPIKIIEGGDKSDGSGNKGSDDEHDSLKIDVNLDIPDKEIENIIDSQFNPIPEEQNVALDEIKNYKIDINKKSDEALQEFQKLFDSRISRIVSEKSKVMIENLTELINNYSQSQIENLEKLSKNTSGLKEGFNTLIQNTTEMNQHMGNLKDQVIKGGGFQLSNIVNNKNKNNGYGGQDLLTEENDDNNNKKKLQIISPTIEREEFINTSKFIEVKDIEIKNIGTETLESLIFAKDEKESSKDIIFIGNDKNIKLQKTTLDGEFTPDKTTKHTFFLKVEYPKINKTYNLIIYAREKENGPNLSNPLKIVIKVKESDEDRIRREQDEEDKKRKEEEAKKKEEEDRIRKEELKKKQEEEEKKRKEKEEEEERKKKEEEEQKKIDDLFNKLNEESGSKLEKEEIVGKIKEFNFDEDKIKEYIKKKNEGNNNIDYQGLNKEDVENLYNELDQEFNISSIMEKEEVIRKIIELKCDRDALNDYIFEKL